MPTSAQRRAVLVLSATADVAELDKPLPARAAHPHARDARQNPLGHVDDRAGVRIHHLVIRHDLLVRLAGGPLGDVRRQHKGPHPRMGNMTNIRTRCRL